MKTLLLPLCCLVAFLPTGISAQPSVEEQMLEELKLLRADVKALKAQVDSLEEKLSEQPKPVDEVEDLGPWGDAWQERKADPEKLAEIEAKINGHLTEGEALQLVQEIDLLTAGQNSFSPQDPQTRLLAKIGNLHPPVIIDAMSLHNLHHHIDYGLNRIKWRDHKELVLDQLAQQPGLVKVLISNGWVEEATPTLLDGLRAREDLPIEWFRAALVVAEPGDHDAVARYFAGMEAWEIDEAYDLLRLERDFDLDHAVELAWEMSRFDDQHDRLAVAQFAAAHGHLDALGVLFGALPDDEDPEGEHAHMFWHGEDPRSIIMLLTPARGSNAELKEWFEAKEKFLIFDPNRSKWFVQQASVS
ncbi:hypothetical protein [Algisphaera agarilytica]|nr:hypothetical protein [Algisphaera agarilytica]